MAKQRGLGAEAMTMPAPLYVCVYVPEFPAQALLRHRPELANAAVVVLRGDPPLQQVCSANANAMRLGVERGMTKAELDSFTGLTVLRRSLAEERAARSALLEAAGVFTPRVEVQPSSEDVLTLVLDMAGATRMFGHIAQIVESIAAKLKALRLFVHVAAGPNLHVAVCVAPWARARPVLLNAGDQREHLARLPLSSLGLSQKQAETLELWGLKTLGELAVLPEVELVVRLGQDGKRLRLLARGEHPHLMVPEEPVFALEEFLEFDSPVELLDSLLFAIGPMLEQLILRAQNRAFALASLTVRLGLDGGGTHERTLKPALPVAQREVLLKLLHLDLQAHPPPAAVLSLFLHAEPGGRSKVQLGLFAPQLPEAMRLDVTLARIAALVGEDRVGRARLLDTHRPEGFVMERFLVPETSAAETGPMQTIALRRCRPAWPVHVRKNSLGFHSFYLRNRAYAVKEAYGPWRRSGQWWSNEVWSYEEWDVCGAADDGDLLLCLITHDLLHNQWQVEGLYD